MARRTKEEMQRMKSDATYYLLQVKLDPHTAHELMVKECLENNRPIPYYIKGVKDFIGVSQELAVILNKEELMSKKEKAKFTQKNEIINHIVGLSLAEIKEIYKEYKSKIAKHEYMELHTLLLIKGVEGEIKKSDVNDVIINLFSKIA